MMAEVPHSIATNEIKIGSVTLVVHNLSNGQRVIEGASVIEFFKAMENGEVLDEADAMKVAKILSPATDTRSAPDGP